MTVLNVPFSYVDRCYLLLGGMVLNRIRTSSRGNESVEVDGREKVAEKGTNMSGVKCEDFGLRNNRKTVKTYKHSKMKWMCVWIHADDNNTHCSHYESNRLTLVTCGRVCVCGFVYECVLVLICTIHIFCIWSQLKRVNSKRNQIVYLRIRYNPCSHIETKIWYVEIHWCFSLMKQGFTTLFSSINAIMVYSTP